MDLMKHLIFLMKYIIIAIVLIYKKLKFLKLLIKNKLLEYFEIMEDKSIVNKIKKSNSKGFANEKIKMSPYNNGRRHFYNTRTQNFFF